MRGEEGGNRWHYLPGVRNQELFPRGERLLLGSWAGWGAWCGSGRSFERALLVSATRCQGGGMQPERCATREVSEGTRAAGTGDGPPSTHLVLRRSPYGCTLRSALRWQGARLPLEKASQEGTSGSCERGSHHEAGNMAPLPTLLCWEVRGPLPRPPNPKKICT